MYHPRARMVMYHTGVFSRLIVAPHRREYRRVSSTNGGVGFPEEPCAVLVFPNPVSRRIRGAGGRRDFGARRGEEREVDGERRVALGDGERPVPERRAR